MSIKARDKTLLRIRAEHGDLRENHPVSMVKDVLAESLLETMDFARRNEFFTRYQHYECGTAEHGLSETVASGSRSMGR